MSSFLFKLVLSHNEKIFSFDLSCLTGFNEPTACVFGLWAVVETLDLNTVIGF